MLPPEKAYNILSIDGGPSGPVQIRMLRKIEEKHPGFLAATDMFAGTSDGAMICMFLASRLPKDKKEAQRVSLAVLDDAIQFSNLTIHALQPRPWSAARFLSGLGPLIDFRRLELVLEQAFGDMRFQQLERSAFVTSFDCNTWRMNNFLKVDEKCFNCDIPVREALLASAALPMYAPVYGGTNGQRYLDGVFVSNTPSTLAAAALATYVHSDEQLAEVDHYVEKNAHHTPLKLSSREDIIRRIRVLSLGLGEEHAAANRPIDAVPTLLQQFRGITSLEPTDTGLNWGWLQWLLQRPTLLPSLLHHAQGDTASLECDIYLSFGNHFRYAPPGATVSVVFDVARRNAEKVIIEAAKLADKLWESNELHRHFANGDPTVKMLEFITKRWMKPNGEEERLQSVFG